jgi:cytoskeletal protein CcmA (bactofilin family)
MGKMLLIVLVGAGFIFSIVNININKTSTSMVGNAVNDFESANAKNIASGGIEFAIKNLSDDTTWSGIKNKNWQHGSLSINVVTTNSSYYNGPNQNILGARLITAIGKVGKRSDTIRAVVKLPSKIIGNDVPPFLEYAIATGKDFKLNGNVNIQDDNNPEWNANVHTNSNFHMNGVNKIKGFLTYNGKATSNPSKRLDENITPNVNPENLANRNRVPQVEIPDFNPDDYKIIADEVYNSNKTFTGSMTLGTKANPKIIYVGGDLTISGNVTGYGVFIVKGNVTLSGNVTVSGGDNSSSSMGIYTKGNLTANGNVTIEGQILSSKDVTFNGNSKVYGSITAKGTANLNGNIDIYYRPANSKLTDPFWEEDGGENKSRPIILSYFE